MLEPCACMLARLGAIPPSASGLHTNASPNHQAGCTQTHMCVHHPIKFGCTKTHRPIRLHTDACASANQVASTQTHLTTQSSCTQTHAHVHQPIRLHTDAAANQAARNLFLVSGQTLSCIVPCSAALRAPGQLRSNVGAKLSTLAQRS